ncbi:MAG: transglycosylase domain-containing protein, partial [Oscillospiraceae bacterium]|nr:transglycosylase domain-containing protein [Oscillospiraceae bacterium]
MDQNQNLQPEGQAAERTAGPRRNPVLTVLRVIGKIIGWIILILFTLCVIGVLTAGIFAKIFMTYIDTTLVPSLGDISYEEMSMSLASTIYAQDGDGNWVATRTLFDNGEETGGGNRELIEYEDVPEHLINALVAIEDKRFWEHQGVDWYGTAGAIYSTLTGGATRGGSTITQQVLRDITEDNEVTVKRKFREIFRALEFEKVTRKEDILTEYLNRVYFGAGCYGIQTAAKTYFGKDVSELDLAESACIVGITNNPSLYDPFRNAEFVQDDGTVKTPRDFNKWRQGLILDQMLEQGYIDEATCKAAKAEKLLFTDTPEYRALYGDPVPEPSEPEEGEEGEAGEEGEEGGQQAAEAVDTSKTYSWYEDAAINDAAELLAEARGISVKEATKNLYRGGYHIYLAQDLSMQKVVDEIYQDTSNFNYPSPTGAQLDSAITIIDPYTGDVKAMAGGVGIKTVNRGLNLATTRRQPGSAIKPVSVYAPAIDYDIITPATVFDDYPLRVNDSGTGGFPRNAPPRYRGSVTVSTGVQVSINTVASRVIEKMGYSTSFEFMENNLGFDLDTNDIALSPLAMGGL